MATDKKLIENWAIHYGLAPRRKDESEKDFENRVTKSMEESGIVANKSGEMSHGKLALMAIFL